MSTQKEKSFSNPGEEIPFPWRMYRFVLPLAIMIAGAIGYATYLGFHTPKVYFPLMDAGMEIRIELAEAHIWFEELIAGNSDKSIDAVWQQLEKVMWYTDALLEGGESEHGVFISVRDPELRRKVKEIQNGLAGFRVSTQRRLTENDTSSVRSKAEREYHSVYREIRLLASEIEIEVKELVKQKIQFFGILEFALIVTAFILASLVGFVLYRFERQRAKDLMTIKAMNSQLDAANQQLEASNQQLQSHEQQLCAANQQLMANEQQLKASNQQLRAQEQQLRAANQQLSENEQQLKAANQQLKANEQQLKASNQQLQATEQQLKASNQQLSTSRQNLALSEERYRLMFENINSGIAVYDAVDDGEDFVFKDINKSGTRISKVSRTEIAGERVSNLFPGIKEIGLFDVFQRVWMTGEPEHHPVSLYTDNRLSQWVENYVYKLPSGEIVAVYDDITARKRVDDALRENEERFLQFADNVGEVFWISDTSQSEILYINDAYADVFGRSIESVQKNPKSWLDSVHPRDREYVTEHIRRAISGHVQEYRIVHPDKSVHWIRSRMFPIRDERSTAYRIGGIAANITEQKKAEEIAKIHQLQLIQADKMTSLGALVSGIAHEINNPNNFIMLNAPILRDAWESIIPVLDTYCEGNGDFLMGGIYYSDMKENTNRLFKGIFEGAQRIQRIVTDLKDFAREDASDVKQIIDINSVVQSAVVLVNNHIKKSTKNFSVQYHDEKMMVKGNFQKLEQVIINLLQNACDALTEPMQGVSVQTELSQEEDMVTITVRDEGSGIRPEDHNRITDPFFTTKRESGGTGLGLSVSSSIVKDHNGTLSFQSQPGEGTVVNFSLPYIRSSHEQFS